jgi:hypothetical protein
VRGRGEQGDSLTKRSYAGGALSFGNQDPVQDWRKSRLQDQSVFQILSSIVEKQSVYKLRASRSGDPFGLGPRPREGSAPRVSWFATPFTNRTFHYTNLETERQTKRKTR